MKAKRIIKKAFQGLLVAFIIVETVLMCFIMIFKMSGKNPSLFGYQFYMVVSPSMEPQLCVGDVIVSKKYTGQPINEGDVITFLGTEDVLAGKVVTHQVIEVGETNGRLSITTKGIANSIPDPSITQDDVLSIMVCKTAVLSGVFKLMSTAPRFILLLILPLVILIVTEIYSMTKILHEDIDGDEEDQQKGESDENEKDSIES